MAERGEKCLSRAQASHRPSCRGMRLFHRLPCLASLASQRVIFYIARERYLPPWRSSCLLGGGVNYRASSAIGAAKRNNLCSIAPIVAEVEVATLMRARYRRSWRRGDIAARKRVLLSMAPAMSSPHQRRLARNNLWRIIYTTRNQVAVAWRKGMSAKPQWRAARR